MLRTSVLLSAVVVSCSACPFALSKLKEGFQNVVGIGYAPSHTGSDWQALAADEKVRLLHRQILAQKTSQPWYTARIAEIFVENLATTFDFVGDDMPSQSFGLEERPKLIHTVGAIALASFNITNPICGYTGLFKSGAANAIIRFSMATQPAATGDVTPGVSLKFLRDGIHSGNVFAMYSLAGQPTYNFFAHDLSNQPPNFDISKAPTALGALASAFERASSLPTMLGLSDLASAAADGSVSGAPMFPFRFILKPARALRTAFPDAPPSPFDSDYYVSQISTLPTGLKIYDVFVIPFPPSIDGKDALPSDASAADPCSDSTPIKIGEITLTSQPAASHYGDQDLFFQHTRMEDDLKVRPEFAARTRALYSAQGVVWPPATYPDLPDA